MKISLQNYSVSPIKVSIFESDVKKLCLFLELRYQIKVGRIAICLFRPLQMRGLMRRFKTKEDQISDVLSFVEDENSSRINGDIAICVDRVCRDAKQDRIRLEIYLREIILHGILHLFGLMHGYTKQELEEVRKLHHRVLERVFMPRELI